MIDLLAAPLPRMPEGLSAMSMAGRRGRGSLDLWEPVCWVAIGDLAAALVAALALSQSAACGAAVLPPYPLSHPLK